MADDAVERAYARVDAQTGQFTPISWSEVKTIIALNQLHLLTRSPAQLSEYASWKSETVAKFGSVEQFILSQRLHWTLPIVPSHKTLFGPGDYEILKNDFPYAFEHGIDHLVVWTKFALPYHDSVLTEDARRQVEEFVNATFGSGPDIIYFMNPVSLKSIGNLEHFHVLLHNIDGSHFLTSRD